MVVNLNSPLFSGPYFGSVATVFDYGFKIYDDTELLVTRTNADDTQSLLELTTDYTVTGVGEDAGGTIVLESGDRLPVGTSMIISPNVAISQARPFSDQSSIELSEIEDSLDKLTSIARQLTGVLGRTVQVRIGADGVEISAGADGTVPQWLNGNLVMGPSAATIAGAEAAAVRAEAAAAQAEGDANVITRYTYTGAELSDVLTLPYAPASVSLVVISIDGIVQEPGSYAIADDQLSIIGGLPAGVQNVGVLLFSTRSIVSDDPTQIGDHTTSYVSAYETARDA